MSKFSKIPSQLKLKDFVFIVGRGRSGTILLRSMLNCNFNVMIAPESLFLMHSLKKYKKKKWDIKNIKSFNNDIWQEGRLKNWGLNKVQTEKFLLKNAVNKDYRYVICLIYYLYAIKNGKYLISILGDENPLYSLFLEDLLKIFPNSKIVHLVRDCRSNIVSFKNVKFDSNNTATLAYRWKRFNLEILKIKHIQKGKIITIKYEKLLQDTQSELKKNL